LGHLPVGKNPEGIGIHPETNLVVVANKKDDTLSLIDLNTAILTTPAPVGKDPRGIGIETDTDLAIVANKKNDTVSLLNLPDGSLVTTLSVGKDPEGMAVDSLSNQAVVTNKKDNTLSIIDLTTQSIVATLPVGKDPHGVAIHPMASLAVVANKKDDTISLIDLGTLTVQSTIYVGRDPLGVAIDPLANQAWVTQEKDDTVTLIDLGTGTVIATLPVGKKPQRIAISLEANQAIVTNKKDNTLSIFDLTTRNLIATIPVGKDPIGIAIHPDTLEAFVANHHDNTVSVIDLGTQSITEILAVGKRPREIAVHPGLNLVVVTNEGDDSVSILQLGTPPTITGFSPTQGPPGTVVVITGEHFDETDPTRNSVFFFNNVAATVTAASAISLSVTVPAGAATGPITVATSSGSATSTQNFIVGSPGPTLTSITPTTGKVGTPVTVIGSNFDPVASDNQVAFNGKGAIISSATITQITTTVPQGATTGPVTVTTPTGTASGGTFTVVLSEDFSVAVNPLSINVVQGGNATVRVNLLGAGEAPYSGLIGLSVGALPTGVTSFFSPSIGQTGRTSFLNLFTQSTLAAGPYPITVQAKGEIDGQTVTRSAAFTLNVLAARTTTLSGQVLSSDTGNPLADILVKNGGTTVTTDAGGNFFFSSISTGTQLLLIDGTPAKTTTVSYPIDLPVQVEITAGTANILPYPVYLHEVNTKHFTLLDTSLGDVIVSDPEIPGFELRIPQGVQIIGWDGQPNTQMSVKSVPIDRLPLPPLPDNAPAFNVYMFYFFKAGGGTPTQPIPVKFPNDAGLEPGTVVDLYYYDEEPVADPNSHQWKKFGTGTVSSDARQIVSDPGVGIPKFCCGGALPTFFGKKLDDKETPDDPPDDGDPVNLTTGI
ncbi:IPT/TIG domain-containing protein, partial [Nitrospira defluvii]|nr:IPT/TIG domain-containing protein [Nitrospira defluvii]